MLIYSKMEPFASCSPAQPACLPVRNMKWKLNTVNLQCGEEASGRVGSVASNRLCFLSCKRLMCAECSDTDECKGIFWKDFTALLRDVAGERLSLPAADVHPHTHTHTHTHRGAHTQGPHINTQAHKCIHSHTNTPPPSLLRSSSIKPLEPRCFRCFWADMASLCR